MRGRYTSTLVDKLFHQYPKFNFAVCHTDHKTDFKGIQGKDWGHIHHEVNVAFHKTIGYVFSPFQSFSQRLINDLKFRYEIYWFKEGSFHRYGDGGYLNVSFSFTIYNQILKSSLIFL